jgi:hypothetical protein
MVQLDAIAGQGAIQLGAIAGRGMSGSIKLDQDARFLKSGRAMPFPWLTNQLVV